ncbi:MAG: serine/threonine-protein kinase [Gemmatimonadota bacterium]
MLAEPAWEQLADAFDELVGLPPEARAAALSRLAGDVAALRARLEAMLHADGQGRHPLDRDVAAAAGDLIGAAPDAPEQIGAYRLMRPLGEGGSAVVYLATRADVGHQVAIKILRDAWLSPARRDRFLVEQRTLAQLSHPGIAQFHDADVLPNGTPWLAMEYVPGQPLTDYCRDRGLGVRDKLLLVRAVAEAVQYAHRHAIIHRDLKPSNILVTGDGNVKVVDFGIAKHLEAADGSDTTRTGLRMLTPAYAAPEQLDHSGVGTYTDVYALGVVLYELLLGRLPAAPPEPSQEEDLDVLCATAMHPDPLRRYRDMDGMIRDIDHFLAAEPLEARPDSFGYRAGKFVRRHAAAVVAAALALVAVVGLIAFYTVRLKQARDAALAESARTARVQRFTQNLFEGGDPSAAPADTLKVITLLDRGLQEARSLEADPRTQSELFQTLGTIYQKLGRLETADTLLLASLEQRKKLSGPNDRTVAEAQIALGLLRMDQARYDEAEQLVRGAQRPADAASTAALGRVLEAKGDYPAALLVLTEAVHLLRLRDGGSTDYAAAVTELANTHFYAGNYDASDSLNREVLSLDRRRHGPRHPSVAEDLINLGATEFERGKYRQAEDYYRQALNITRSWYGEEHYATAGNLTMLGRALVREERWDEATATLRQALVIREKVFGPMHPNVASTVNELGTIELRRERYPEAERYYARAVDIYRTAYHGKHYLIGIGLSNVGSVRLGQGDNVGAEKVFREALARFSETLSANHSNVGIIRIKLGRALVRQRRWADAVAETKAGHDILAKQASPSIRFLEWARADLTTAYAALGRPAEAAKYAAPPAGGKP